jgi:hypothetical protein
VIEMCEGQRGFSNHSDHVVLFDGNRFPIHCAVMGGNLDLVKWLVETQECPISVRRDSKTNKLLSIQTSKSRTLVDLAMTGRPKIDILGYLVNKNLSVLDAKDPTLAPKTLQTLMSAGYRFELRDGEDGGGSSIDSFSLVEPSDASVTSMEDAVSEPSLFGYSLP